MTYRLILVFFIILFFHSNLFCDEKYSDFILSGGLGLNMNIHSGSFKGFVNDVNLLPSFSSGFGLGGRIFAGGEYIFKKKLFGSEIHGGLDISYSNLSATLLKDEFIGNIITGNTYTQGTSEHRLETHISVIMLEPSLIMYPFKQLPLSATAGFQLGFPFNMTYYQEEKLIHPDFGTYENGQRVRDTSSGGVPLPASVYFALSIGARYELYKSDNFSLLPVVRFNFGLTNLASNVNWKASSISFNALMQYRIPLPKKKINPPPIPLPPPPPEVKQLQFALKVFYNGNELIDGDTIKVKVVDTLYVNKFYVNPVIFFAENKTDFGMKNGIPKNAEDAQNMSYRAIQAYLAGHPDSKIKIISSATSDEDSATAGKRLNTFVKKFGIDSTRLTKELKIEAQNEFRHKELEEENRYVSFETGDKEQGLNVAFDSSETSFIDNVELRIKPEFEPIRGNNKFDGSISLNGNKVFSIVDSEKIYPLNDYLNKNYLLNNGKITLEGTDSDETGQSRKEEINLYMKAEPYQARLVENLSSGIPGSTGYHEYIVGFCEFNKSEIYSINQHAVDVVKEALSKGKTIEILPLTDSLGTKEYNHELALKRAETAARVLSIDLTKVKLTIPTNYLFSNDSPEGRLMNRSVIVRIY